MRKKQILMLGIFLMVFGGTLLPVYGQTNLLLNGDFEEGKLKYWGSESSKPGSAIAVTTVQYHSGKNAVEIKADSPNDTKLIQIVKVRPNSFYRFSGWLKVKNVTLEKVGANLGLANSFDCTPSLNGNTGWKYKVFNFRTHKSQKEVMLTVRLGLWGNEVTGTAWFDDLRLVKLRRAPASYIRLDEGEEENEEVKQVEENPIVAQPKIPFDWMRLVKAVLVLLIIGLQIFILEKCRRRSID